MEIPILDMYAMAGKYESEADEEEKTRLHEAVFSVVIPVYNRALVLHRAVDSVLAQTFANFELIIVDDGSTDDIATTMGHYGDARVSFVRQPNRGASAARNHGIDVARGRFVAFLDSDDTFLPHHLETMHVLLSERERMIAYSPVRAQRGSKYIIKPSRAIAPGEPMADYLMCSRGFVQTSGLVVPTAVARGVRYREDVSFGDDTDFAIRLHLAGNHFIMAATPSVDWFDGPDPDRLSNAQLDADRLRWLDDLRPQISRAAYHGYRGWHVAKGLFRSHPLAAMALYLNAIVNRSYHPRLAAVIFAQIVVPGWMYRDCSDFFIGLMMRRYNSVRSEGST